MAHQHLWMAFLKTVIILCNDGKKCIGKLLNNMFDLLLNCAGISLNTPEASIPNTYTA